MFIFLFVATFSYANAVADFQCKLPLKPPEVLFLIPAPTPNLFWDSAIKSAKNASLQLGIKLTVHHLDESEVGVHQFPQALNQLLTHKYNPDYVISFVWLGSLVEVLEISKKHNIKLFTTDFTINEKLLKMVGKPREKYKHWIGHLAGDGYQVGYDLASVLIDKSTQHQLEKLTMVAITGKRDSEVSEQRLNGLLARVYQSDRVELLQYVYSDWTPEQGEYLTEQLFKRYHAIDIIWSASDNMTIGIVKALNKRFIQSDNHVLVGSIDWSHEVAALIKKSQVTVSFGGHILNSAYILALIVDYHNGYDFQLTRGTIITTKLYPLSKESIDNLTDEKLSTLDFSLLSQCFSQDKVIELDEFIPSQLLN